MDIQEPRLDVKENEDFGELKSCSKSYATVWGFIDRYYLVLMFLMAIIVTCLNYSAEGMTGLIPNYLGIKRIILANFDLSAAQALTPTFPMWGYSWIFIVTEHKPTILILQQLFALFTVGYSIRFIEKNVPILENAIRIIKILMVITVPWYVFHSLLWPYSIAINIFILSILLAYLFFKHDSFNLKTIILSGLLFGLTLNFRSDYYMLPFGLVFVALLVTGFTKRNLLKSGVWLLVIYFSLVPWLLYTRHVTGHYLFTSTNSGHVFFIGLGNLPDNKWNITPYDGDPLMNSLVEEQFGKGTSTLVYESDKFLKKEFIKRVKKDPQEYVRKIIHNICCLVTEGVYGGEFGIKYKKYLKAHPEVKNLDRISRFKKYPDFMILSSLEVLSHRYGQILIFLSFIFLIFTGYIAIKKLDLFLIILLYIISYQSAINIFAYHMQTYTTNVLFFHIINVSFGIVLIQKYFNSRRMSSIEAEDKEKPTK